MWTEIYNSNAQAYTYFVNTSKIWTSFNVVLHYRHLVVIAWNMPCTNYSENLFKKFLGWLINEI
jgi:hypothetical protein